MKAADFEHVSFRFQGGAFGGLRRAMLALGVACLVIGALLLLGPDGRQMFLFSYLTAWIYCLTISLGALFFVMVHHLAGARWSIVLRRLAEELMMTLPLVIVLFIPIALYLPDIYEWANPHHVHDDHLLQLKAPYLNPPFFMLRALIYFAIWLGLALKLYGWSLRQDQIGDPALNESMRKLSAPGMLLFALSITFASFDWIMSLDPHWYSTILGVYLFGGSFLAFLAVMILVSLAVSLTGAVGPAITIEHFHDLGKLLFAFVVFWAYIAFSQAMLIWMANIPEETIWYLHRWQEPSWRALSWFLILGHFVAPFLYLLPRTVKRTRGLLALGAAWLLIAHFVDLYWLIMPTFPTKNHGVPASPLPIFLTLGLLGIFLAFYAWRLQRQPLVPVRDPHLADSLAFENV